jgi:hypothetical protein
MRSLKGMAGTFALIVGLVAAGSGVAHASEPGKKGAPRFTQSGVGDALVRVPKAYKPIVITATHDGQANFIVEGVGKDGEASSLLVNTIGPYSGTVYEGMGLFSGFTKKNPMVALSIRADGPWTIRTKPLAAAPKKSAKSGQGTASAVIKLRKITRGLTKGTFTHQGESNFIVYALDTKGTADLLVNEIGPYKGSVRVPSGTRYLSITAEGPWTYRMR